MFHALKDKYAKAVTGASLRTQRNRFESKQEGLTLGPCSQLGTERRTGGFYRISDAENSSAAQCTRWIQHSCAAGTPGGCSFEFLAFASCGSVEAAVEGSRRACWRLCGD